MEADECSSIQVADEGDWLELLIASERIENWLDTILSGNSNQKCQAALQLLESVQRKETYAEEARAAGAVRILTNLLSKTEDERLLSTAVKIIAACSGPLASSTKVQRLVYGEHTVWIQEGALGDGLGSRIWIAAHILCRELARSPELVSDLEVLELGSGCGLCGILALKLGAGQVTLTDYEHKVLLNMVDCVARNTSPQELVNGRRSWDMGRARVRFLDWSEALHPADAKKLQREDSVIGRARGPEDPPILHENEKFRVIIGSDLLYELFHSEMVAAVLAKRLALDGAAHIALAVRRQEHLDHLLEQCDALGLTSHVSKALVDPEDVGIVGREHEYEGGFVMVSVRHR